MRKTQPQPQGQRQRGCAAAVRAPEWDEGGHDPLQGKAPDDETAINRLRSLLVGLRVPLAERLPLSVTYWLACRRSPSSPLWRCWGVPKMSREFL